MRCVGIKSRKLGGEGRYNPKGKQSTMNWAPQGSPDWDRVGDSKGNDYTQVASDYSSEKGHYGNRKRIKGQGLLRDGNL